MVRCVFMGLLAAVPSLSLAAEPKPFLTTPLTERSDALMRSAMIAEHNAARTAYGVAPLQWDDALAADALAYARTLARTQRFVHDEQEGARVHEGENLFAGTRQGYGYTEMVRIWIDERADFRPGRFPDISTSGNWRSVGHYTQIVWPGTKTFGCAMASSETDDYLVCRYLPAGNVIGVTMR